MTLCYRRLVLPATPRLLLRLKKRMRYVRAAGGMVVDAEGHVLSIQRNGRWDLPKGKVEAGETLAEAALREVEEETGIKATIDGPRVAALKTYHIFNLYGGWHLKQTSWFRMRTDGNAPATTPQQEEGISTASWTTPQALRRGLRSSYGTLRTLAKHWIWSF